MRIARVAAYRQLQPFRDGPYRCRNQSEDGTDSTIVVLESDDGLVGVGEMAPLGAFYAPAFAAGTRAGVGGSADVIFGS
jgi:cis-L-3-hydroxyproline dehydratase